jgi:pimeloyl-ACP methyl ester carboxylesterase
LTPIIMVHGAFCGGWTFDLFRVPFEAAGYPCLTPDLRGGAREGKTAGLSMDDYAKDIAALVKGCETPPVLMGHSLGGLVAQMAAAKAPVAGLILLAPSAPWGVQGGSMEEAVSAVSLYALGPFWSQAVAPDYALAKGYSLDRLSSAERRAIFERMAPESGLALWQTLNWWLDPFMTTRVAADRIKAPVLAIAGGRDVIHPAATVRQTAARLSGTVSVFPEMSHWLPGEPGYLDVAATCLDWMAQKGL